MLGPALRRGALSVSMMSTLASLFWWLRGLRFLPDTDLALNMRLCLSHDEERSMLGQRDVSAAMEDMEAGRPGLNAMPGLSAGTGRLKGVRYPPFFFRALTALEREQTQRRSQSSH